MSEIDPYLTKFIRFTRPILTTKFYMSRPEESNGAADIETFPINNDETIYKEGLEHPDYAFTLPGSEAINNGLKQEEGFAAHDGPSSVILDKRLDTVDKIGRLSRK